MEQVIKLKMTRDEYKRTVHELCVHAGEKVIGALRDAGVRNCSLAATPYLGEGYHFPDCDKGVVLVVPLFLPFVDLPEKSVGSTESLFPERNDNGSTE